MSKTSIKIGVYPTPKYKIGDVVIVSCGRGTYIQKEVDRAAYSYDDKCWYYALGQRMDGGDLVHPDRESRAIKEDEIIEKI